MKFTAKSLVAAVLFSSLTYGTALAQIQPATVPVNSRRGFLTSRMKAQPTGRANHQAKAQPQVSPDITLTFGMIDFPGQPATNVYGVNDKGEIVGEYGSTFSNAFYLKGTKFTEIAYPGAAWTQAEAINDSGVIVGDAGTSPDDEIAGFGFVLEGKTFTAINYPGAVATYAFGINKHEDIVGEFDNETEGSYTETGYLLSKGAFTVIAVPGAVDTVAYSINDAGAIVGTYLASDDSTHGFLYQSGTYTTIDYPGGFSQNELSGINDSGVIVGAYGDAVQFQHAFIYQSGQFTNADVPFGPPALIDPGTISNNGVIVGTYVDDSGTSYGYEATIAP
jgi:probable HAF family extracellular repeat protein